jgi:hypothetical protein
MLIAGEWLLCVPVTSIRVLQRLNEVCTYYLRYYVAEERIPAGGYIARPNPLGQ